MPRKDRPKSHKVQVIGMVRESTRDFLRRKSKEMDVSLSQLVRHILQSYEKKTK